MPRKPASIIIRHGTIVTIDSSRQTITDGAIAVVDNKIVDVGPDSELIEKWEARETIDATGMAVLPGFVNAHTHATHNLLRGGLSQDRNLYDWLLNVLYAGLNQYTGADARVAAKLYCIEAIRGGITTSVDNADWGMVDELAESTIEAYQEYGIRAIYARMFSDQIPAGEDDLMEALARREPKVIHPPTYVEELDKALASMERLMKKYHGGSDGRIGVWPSPGIVHFVSADGLLKSLELARDYDAMVSTHLAESPDDAKIYGISSTQYLAYIGYLDERLLAGHCVWMDDRDLRLLKKFDVRVAHNCVSNLYLASGIAPIAKMINMGITTSIGTDDCNCNESVNMISDMKHVALLQKVANLDSGAITAEKVLEMATINGARALRMDKHIGSLEAGKKADIILIDLQYPHLTPCHQIPSTLVYQANGSEVDTTIVDGKILMREGKLTIMSAVEEQSTFEKAQAASVRIADKAGMHWRVDRGWQTASI
jgi:atrazine chlorohydrolase/5-methylthioadenosine/S-adenosylhomocysteine deaminase/melamine deaminase